MATDVQGPDAAIVERVVRAIREHEAELRALGVTRLWLFGSLARGDPGRRSDVDVLISVPPAHDFSAPSSLDNPLGRATDSRRIEAAAWRDRSRSLPGIWPAAASGA
jgi:predicted nucleotidyltransferase